MGCEVVVGGASTNACSAIEELFEAGDCRFSRFLADSELNRVNVHAGRPVQLSQEFASMLALALEAARETNGLVDPTLGVAIDAAGYDRDFDELRDDGRASEPRATGVWSAVLLAGRYAVFPPDVRLDLNGVVKAKTVDDAVTLLDEDGFVSAGGDIAVRGGAVVALPGGDTIRVVRGALATSGTDRRRWLRGGTMQHHLIDPHTGAPSRSRWQTVTACGATCVAADVLAKGAFLLDDEGPEWLDARGVPGRFVAEYGSVHTNDAWDRSLVPDLACT
jgi:thiamine biosynthesis lipoprotein